ncbi:MAG: hypothetical protein R3F56_18740 [Planctomycetota bacterium]
MLKLHVFLSGGLLCATALAQTGRTLSLTTPATLGGTAQVTIAHPASAGGNYYEMLGSGPNTNAINIGNPRVFGLFLLDLPTYFSWSNGLLGTGTSTTVSLPIANNISLVGAVLETQAADLDVAAPSINLSDNDLQLRIVLGICKLTMVQSTSTSTLTGDSVLHQIDDTTLGTPSPLGPPAFACQVIRHRGQEGFVEGFAGTFSATSHNSDIDSISHRRVAKRTLNSAFQLVTLPNGYDVAIIRDNANQNQFSVMSYNRATGAAMVIPGTTVVDTSATPPSTSTLAPYMSFSNDGNWACVVVHDLNASTPPPDRVLAFRTDGSAPAIDITATAPASTTYFDGAHYFMRDFLIVVGTGGWYWTSATSPSTLQPLTLPNTTASNAPPIWVFSFSWRVSRDGAVAYFPSGSNASASRAEMEIYQISDNSGTPQVLNVTQFAAPTGLAEFGFSAITPSTANNSSNGIKAAVSPDGSMIAALAATSASTTAFPGVYVWTGAPNPALITVPGATYYSELTFLNDNTVLFFAGTSNTAQDLYKYEVNTATVTAMTSVGDIRTRGQFWSLNKHWWYFVRSDSTNSKSNLVGVSRKTGAMKDITGNEFSAPSVPPRPSVVTGAFNTTADPWFALEMQLRRAPLGDFAYFTARRPVPGGVFEDANVFRFDIENGGQAEVLTNNTTQGALAAIKTMESLMISADGAHLAWAQRVGTATTSSEDVIHFRTTTNQMSVSDPAGQTITDGSIYFTCLPPNGIVYSVGSGSSTVPVTNTRIEWVGLGTNSPIPISGAIVPTRAYQVLNTFN